ncbi:MAG: hypothetical protein L0Z51_00070, partial [Candidatus Latescibacteria bacterium]|nr:hypothetical protein [Candidatus Latescibacterota bacterium]
MCVPIRLRIPLLGFLILLASNPLVALEPDAGTPRIARRLNLDRGGQFGGPFATSHASADTTILGAWRFDAGPVCELQGWASVDLTAGVDDFGDYAGLSSSIGLVQRDACAKNLSCAWAFIARSTDTYSCGGFPTQASVP